MADSRLRQIRIKGGIVKRISKEKVSYEKEAEKQRQRVGKMKDEGKDEYDIRKQYQAENTGSRPITEVKQLWARSVPGKVTMWEHCVQLANKSAEDPPFSQIPLLWPIKLTGSCQTSGKQLFEEEEVLQETLMMVPDCLKRLRLAYSDLKNILESECDLSEAEDYQVSQAILHEAEKMLL